MRRPSGPAMTAAWARPMKSPCSTTPGIAASRSASERGSAIRCSAASRMKWPPSVTKAWPALSRRSVSGPALPVRRSRPRPRARSRRGRTARPRSAAESARASRPIWSCRRSPPCRAEAAATIFSRSSAPPPPLIKVRSGAISSAPSMVRSSSGVSSSVVSGMPHCSACCARRLRGRHRDHVEAGAHALAEHLDERPRGRAGAEPEPHSRAGRNRARRRRPRACRFRHS